MYELFLIFECVRIFEEVLLKSMVGVEEVVRKFDVSKGLVLKIFYFFVKYGIVVEKREKVLYF